MRKLLALGLLGVVGVALWWRRNPSAGNENGSAINSRAEGSNGNASGHPVNVTPLSAGITLRRMGATSVAPVALAHNTTPGPFSTSRPSPGCSTGC